MSTLPLTDSFKLLSKELERLTLLADFDDKIYDAQIDVIIAKLNKLKRHPSLKTKIEDTGSVKSWADQSEEEDKEREIELAKKEHAKTAWSQVIARKPLVLPSTTTQPKSIYDSLYDYPFTQNMKAYHYINFHCNTYHWTSRWFEGESRILVKTEKYVAFTIDIINGRAVLSFYTNDDEKHTKLCLMDQVVTCYDQDGKSYDMKVKLIKDAIVMSV